MLRRPRSAPVRRTVATTTALLAAGLLGACTGSTPGSGASPEPTPLASYDGRYTQVERVSFCSRIPDAAVRDAAGRKVTTSHYGNGERLPGTEDVSHEYGCVFTGEDGTVARSWVFVPPVTPARAKQLAGAARRTPGCAETPAPKFGTYAVGTVCTGGDLRTVTFRGLFGDAWLACSVARPLSTASTKPASSAKPSPSAKPAPSAKPDASSSADATAALVAKAGTWCVQVATTASAS